MDQMASTTTHSREGISGNILSTSGKGQQFQVKSLTDFASTRDKILTTTGIILGFIHGSKWIILPLIVGSVNSMMSIVSLDKNYSSIISLESKAFAPRSSLDGFHTYSIFQQTYGLNASVAATVIDGIYTVIPIYMVLLPLSIMGYFGMNITLQQAASNQVQRMKVAFVDSLLKQDIDWFDNSQPSRLISQTEIDFNIYQDCIGMKLGILSSYMSLYIVGFFYCMILHWQMALVGYSSSLLIISIYTFSTKVQQRYSENETKSYSEAGIVAEDALTAIKTVIGYNGQANENHRYSTILIQGSRAGIVKSGLKATFQALISLVFMSTLALMSWSVIYLYHTIERNSSQKNSAAYLIAVFMIIFMSQQFLVESITLANYVLLAKSSGKRLLEIINKKQSYNCTANNDNWHMINTIDNIEFKDVEFSYSSRKDKNVLRYFNLMISKGEKVALVGNSGSGKSTVVSLLHRFYDPTKGSIMINGHDIKELNLDWLRSQIGVVNQEPVLFPTTIYENIRYGFAEASKEDIEMAAKMANAHNFIVELPLKYDTKIGDRGTQLSGGQKQRIAIARALLRKPPILLLDEATSALDSRSESIVQQALDNARFGRTSIIIAHRLSTIRNADKIVVMSDGEIVEFGNHDSLMKANGYYYRLVKMQCRNDGDITLNVINSSSESLAENVEHHHSKKTKLDHSKSKLVERNEFPPNAKRVNSERLSHIQSIRFFRLLTIGGHGPMFICLGVLASISQGLGILLLYVYVLPAWYDIFGTHNPIVASNTLHTLLFKVMGCAIVLVISTFLMILFLELSGALIAKRLRLKLFHSFMSQEVSWFDQSRASVGNLCLILSQDTENVKMTLSTHLGIIVTAITQTVAGLIIIFLMSWIYGCISVFFYIMAFAFPIYTKQITHKSFIRQAESSTVSNEMLREVVMNIRTIRFLGAEDEFRKLYMQNGSFKHIKKNICSYHIPMMEAIVDSNSQLANFCNVLVTPTLFLHNYIIFNQFLSGVIRLSWWDSKAVMLSMAPFGSTICDHLK